MVVAARVISTVSKSSITGFSHDAPRPMLFVVLRNIEVSIAVPYNEGWKNGSERFDPRAWGQVWRNFRVIPTSGDCAAASYNFEWLSLLS